MTGARSQDVNKIQAWKTTQSRLVHIHYIEEVHTYYLNS